MEPKRILIIDDSEMEIALLKFLIENIEMPLSIHFEKCGVYGLSYLENIKKEDFPEVIISDINLTLMSGVEFFEQISNLYPDSWKNSSFFVTSAVAPMASQKARFSSAHIQGFLEKPLMETTLVSLFN